MDMMESASVLVELNVGGVVYGTTIQTLSSYKDSLLAQMMISKRHNDLFLDSKGRYFVDRDGVLFRYILDFLRNDKLVLPENFHERERLRIEAEYFRLPALIRYLDVGPASGTNNRLPPLSGTGQSRGSVEVEANGQQCNPCCIIVGYRGTFAFGRDGMADIKFRKLSRILVQGRVTNCREVFGDTLNESRDPDRGSKTRYTSRFFLKHQFLEQAFEQLLANGYKLAGSCASGSNGSGDQSKAMDTEETRWQHYNEFIWTKV